MTGRTLRLDANVLDRLRATLDRVRTMDVGSHVSEEELVACIEGHLPDPVETRLWEHCAGCGECSTRLASLTEEGVWQDQAHLNQFSNGLIQAVCRISQTDERIRLQAPSTPEAALVAFHRLPRPTLASLGAIEREGDYVLPSGVHCDTHVNVSKLAHSDSHIREVALGLAGLTADIQFDTVVCTGWPTATIARCLGELRGLQGRGTRVVIAEGYSSVRLSRPVKPGSRAIVLTDVVVSGRLLERVAVMLKRCEASAAAAISIAAPAGWQMELAGYPEIRVLEHVAMAIEAPETCPRCGRLPQFEFNPISCCMTERRPPRSTSEYLEEHPDVVSFLEILHDAGAFEYHRRESTTHLIGFIDTVALMTHRATRRKVRQDVAQALGTLAHVPDFVAFPGRRKSRLFARLVISEIEKAHSARPSLLECVRDATGWSVPQKARSFRDSFVLIVDNAVGHGQTMDDVAGAVRRGGAGLIGAVVLLSRLSDNHEAALRQRWQGGFRSVYRFQARPLCVEPSDGMCEFCRWKSSEQPPGVSIGRGRREPDLRKPVPQELPFADERSGSLLRYCRPAIASAAVWSALSSAKNNGMAPLRMPELFEESIAAPKRAAMVDFLTGDELRWIGEPLRRDLEKLVGSSEVDTVWLASAQALARSGSWGFLQVLEVRLRNWPELPPSREGRFWRALARDVYAEARANLGFAAEVRRLFSSTAASAQATGVALGAGLLVDSAHRAVTDAEASATYD